MTHRLRGRLEALEAARMFKTEEEKRAQLRAALLALSTDCLKALKEEGQHIQDPTQWADFKREGCAYYAAHTEEAHALNRIASWPAWKAQKGQPFALPPLWAADLLEAHAGQMWASLERAKTKEARAFFRYTAACLQLRASLARVLLGRGQQ